MRGGWAEKTTVILNSSKLVKKRHAKMILNILIQHKLPLLISNSFFNEWGASTFIVNLRIPAYQCRGHSLPPIKLSAARSIFVAKIRIFETYYQQQNIRSFCCIILADEFDFYQYLSVECLILRSILEVVCHCNVIQE